MSGRREDGEPLLTGGAGQNDFRRRQDQLGGIWPLASHTSKMNSREGGAVGSLATFNRPIVRRGVPYQNGDGRVGLHFQCFQYDLEGQFEVLFHNWAQDPDVHANGTGLDPVLGAGPKCLRFPSTNANCAAVGELTTIRGGEYFYFPSIPGLFEIAQGAKLTLE